MKYVLYTDKGCLIFVKTTKLNQIVKNVLFHDFPCGDQTLWQLLTRLYTNHFHPTMYYCYHIPADNCKKRTFRTTPKPSFITIVFPIPVRLKRTSVKTATTTVSIIIHFNAPKTIATNKWNRHQAAAGSKYIMRSPSLATNPQKKGTSPKIELFFFGGAG